MNRYSGILIVLVLFLSGEAFSQRANNVPKSGKSVTKASSTKKKNTENDIIGTWQLTKFKHGPQSKKRKPLTSCDTLMPWVFFKDSTTQKLRLICEQVENCEDYGFESEWLFNGNSLIIKKTKIMGFGGISSSGKFSIKELTPDHMVLDFMKHLYVFRKIK